MIDSIFQNKIFRAWTEPPKKSNTENIEPSKWIFSARFCTNNRKWKSKFTIVVVWRNHNICFSEFRRKKCCYMSSNSRLPYCSSNTDDIRLLELDNRTGKKAKKRKKNCLHKSFMRNTRKKRTEIKKKTQNILFLPPNFHLHKSQTSIQFLHHFLSILLWHKLFGTISHSLFSMRYKPNIQSLLILFSEVNPSTIMRSNTGSILCLP